MFIDHKEELLTPASVAPMALDFQTRDGRLDFFRGLALVMIFIDHIPANPLGNWTLRNFAFCDAAEIFVLISGISSYIAYGPKIDRRGAIACLPSIARRWMQIYFAHFMLLFGAALALLAAAWVFARPDYLGFLRMGWLVAQPKAAIFAALTLRYLPNTLDILPLYLVFLPFAPFVIWGARRSAAAVLAGSFAIYLAARWSGINLAAGNSGELWSFNPFAWQLLYVAGIVACHVQKARPALLAGVARKTATAAAVAFVLFALAMSLSWSGGRLGSVALWPSDKQSLAPLRIVNVLALLYLACRFVPSQARWLQSALARPFVACGRHSLAVFGAGILLSVLGHIGATQCANAPSVYLVLNLGGILSLFALGLKLDKMAKQ